MSKKMFKGGKLLNSYVRVQTSFSCKAKIDMNCKQTSLNWFKDMRSVDARRSTLEKTYFLISYWKFKQKNIKQIHWWAHQIKLRILFSPIFVIIFFSCSNLRKKNIRQSFFVLDQQEICFLSFELLKVNIKKPIQNSSN